MAVHVAVQVNTVAAARLQDPAINTEPDQYQYSRAVPKFCGLSGAGYVLHDLRMKGGKQYPSKRHPFDMAKMRRDELDRLLIARTGSMSLETDDASFFALIYAHHCDTPEQAMAALRARFPALGDVERAAIVASAFARPRKYKADPLAAMLNVTFEERQRLGFRTIGACDQSREDRKRIAYEEHCAIEAERLERKRRAEGVIPREEYLANSVAAEARRLGVSRTTLYRRRKAEEKAREAACYKSVATREESNLPSCNTPVTPPAQVEAAAQPATHSDRPGRAPIWIAAFNWPASPRSSIPLVAANSDPTIARLGARVAAHAAAHRKAALVFATMRRAA